MHTSACIASLVLVLAACHHADPALGPVAGPRMADGGDRFDPSVQGVDGGSADGAPTAPSAMSIASVKISGHASNEVRQGSGDVELVAEGCGLDGVVSAMIGDRSVSLTSVAYDRVIVSATVPHGMNPVSLPLTLTKADGTSASRADALVVTAIHVALVGHDDAEGTPTFPLATVTRALSLAGNGDTVQLAAGQYAAAETWAHTAPNVPAGVTLVGHDVHDTVLVGPGNDDSVGLWAAGKVDVSELHLTGFRRGIVASTDAIGLKRVLVDTASEAGLDLTGDAWLGTDTVELYDCAIGARLTGKATLSLNASMIDLSRTGIAASDDAQVIVSASTISTNGTTLDKRHSGVYLTDRASATISATIDYNATAGVYSESTGAVKLEGDIHHNGRAAGCANNYLCSGVVVEAQTALTLQSQLLDNTTYGLATRGHHVYVSMNGSTLSDNGLANAVFDDTDPSIGGTTVMIGTTTFSNSQNGIVWGDRVNLQVTQSAMSGHAFGDLTNNMVYNGWVPTFTDVKFGSGSIYPPKPKSGTLVTSASGAPVGGPTWTIAHPVDAGGFGQILFKHQ